MGINDWSRGRTIGRGSTATVSLATSSLSGEVFAVKSAELNCFALLQREQSILSALESPHIISYRGFDTNADTSYLFMEYAPGGSISDRISKQGGPLDEPAVRAYAYDILCGLAYLHSNGVAHCDIKGQNVLIGSDGRAKIADLGCARWVESDGTGGQMRGTPRFMAPEVARGEEQGTPADVWALGCAVIEMATGRPPWPDVSDPVAALRRIAFTTELPEFRGCVSGEGRDFLSKCLERDPRERWTAGELLKHPFVAEATKHRDSSSDPDSWSWVSPKSTLDQGLWDSSSECPSDDPAERIRQQFGRGGGGVSTSPVANWTWNGNWVTIRSNDTETECPIVQSPDEQDRSLVEETDAGGGGEGDLVGASRSEAVMNHTNHMDTEDDFFSNDLFIVFPNNSVVGGAEEGVDVNCNSNSNSIGFLVSILFSIFCALFSMFITKSGFQSHGWLRCWHMGV